MEFHEPDRPGTLAVEAREGHFCEQTWRFEGDLRFRYRDLSGTAARARIEWSKEWLYADGPVDLRDARGRQAQAQAMSVDLKTERIELVNPSPRRGRLTWTETTRP
jgi:lipopolysaccharide assembly outer membrane protein LptD (OstA)